MSAPKRRPQTPSRSGAGRPVKKPSEASTSKARTRGWSTDKSATTPAGRSGTSRKGARTGGKRTSGRPRRSSGRAPLVLVEGTPPQVTATGLFSQAMNAGLGAHGAYTTAQLEAAEAARQAGVFFNSYPGRWVRRFFGR